jgi:hypothetical protein
MKPIVRATIALIFTLTLAACGTTFRATDFSLSDVNYNIDEWPPSPKEAVSRLVKKYGQPDEMTYTMVIWTTNGQWRKTEVFRDEVPHDFPMSHMDFLKQTINYRVPIDKYDDLAVFDGSLTIDRTKGTLSATCDKEELNFLAINLANEIVMGKITVAQAREKQAKIVSKFYRDESDPYLEGFIFQVSANSAADRDVSVSF